MTRRVVITGMGLVSPLGNDVATAWENAKKGVNGIDVIRGIDVSDMQVSLAGEVRDLDVSVALDRKEARRMDRFSQFACVAGKEAMDDAAFGNGRPDAERFGVHFGSGVGGMSTFIENVERLVEKGPGRVSPLLVPMMTSNMAAGNLAILHGLEGPCSCVVTACATGANSIGDAFRIIKHGYADAMLTGGSEAAITRLGMAGFLGLQALSVAKDKDRASIPFDAERNGFVMGEGGAALVLEEYEHAKKRGAKMYGEVLGYGMTGDAYHMTAPHPDGKGPAKAMELAMGEAGVLPQQVDYINAHGTSTLYNDKIETMAIKQALGEHAKKVAVSSTKSMTGHLLGAAGAMEAIFCVLAIRDGFAPPTINYQVADPDCDLDVLPKAGRAMTVDYALSNSLGFGGHNASLLFGRVL
ncbi:MAG: beta-ketoacyl-ACP synthase II [Christensenellales bacterium]|jgi:3-oxoacyl-[acyl-carrier-protein] synthase II